MDNCSKEDFLKQIEGLENELTARNARIDQLEMILSSQDTGLSVINDDMTIEWVNDKVKQMIPGNDHVGQKCFVCYEGSSSPCSPCPTIASFKSGMVCQEERLNQSNGRWYQIISQPIKDDKNRVQKVLEGITDITERKIGELALKESEARYKALFETISDAVYVHDVHGKLIDVNTEAHVRLGYTRDEILKLFASDVDINYPTADEVKRKIEPAIMSGPLRIESRHRAKDGMIFNVELNMNVFNEKGKDIFVTVARDMTERLVAEKEKEKLIADLNHALVEVKKLSGLIPICSICKKIRDDTGYWNQIEEYIQDHSEAQFSHSICKECAEKYYPDFDAYEDGRIQK